MDDDSPEHSSSPPDHFRQHQHLNSNFSLPHPVADPLSDDDMATLVVSSNPSNMPSHGVNKRYRPAPAKTFQCRGYGECRMVFSRSEHLARHIRKHTGERPFSCHCGKQFSRLDNLRQHAQTVHADKQEQNERMMRDLTSLHATMAAANKAGQPRGKRSQASSSSNSSGSPVGNSTSNNANSNSNSASANHVKEEDDSQPVLPVHHRPGTSTGYEGDHNGIIYQTATNWHVQPEMNRNTSKPNHSFRDPGQSFLAPSSSTSAQSQSFLPFPTSFNFNLPDSTRDGRPGSSSSRPPTSESHPRSLPPLASVVPTSIPPPASHSQPQPQPPSFSAQQHVLHFPGFRRPSTATRPGTAPASYFVSKPPYIGGPGLVPRPDLSFLAYGRDMAAPQPSPHSGGYDSDLSASPTAGASYDSPFSFHPPAIADSQLAASAAPGSPPPPNPRKRSFTGADGPEYGGADYEYDYGSESRPQSRRLSVMELCNDQPTADRALLLLSGSGGSRPGTSSGLISSANALALVDRSPTISVAAVASGTSPPLLARTSQAAAIAIASAPGGEMQFIGGGIPSAPYRGIPSSSTAAAATATATILQPVRGSPTFSDASVGYSPRSAPSPSYHTRSPQSPFSAAARGIQSQSKSPSPATAADVLSRRAGNDSQHDQVRIPVSASHTPTAVGMRV
jgi:hypothetical protein